VKLFAVRGIGDNEAVGFFWVNDMQELWFMIDEITDPGTCEFCEVNEPAAVTWAGDAPAMGIQRKDVEDEINDRDAFAREASFDYALGDALYGEIIKGWIKVPDAAGGFPASLREWGSWKRGL
jgi:hypothetical protein